MRNDRSVTRVRLAIVALALAAGAVVWVKLEDAVRSAPPVRWDGSYIVAYGQDDWRCPQLRDDEALIVEHGTLRMPWHIHGAEDGVWAGFDVGQFRGTVDDDGTAAVTAEVTARTLPPAMIETGYTAASIGGGIAALRAAVPRILFRVDDEGRHATFVMSTGCILDLGVVGEPPRAVPIDTVDNRYPFAGVQLDKRDAAYRFHDLDRSPGVSYSFSAKVRTLFPTAPVHRVLLCIQRSCNADPADPGWGRMAGTRRRSRSSATPGSRSLSRSTSSARPRSSPKPLGPGSTPWLPRLTRTRRSSWSSSMGSPSNSASGSSAPKRWSRR
jgi:hypothetical protein